MGKYLDMVRKFEARRQAEGRTEPQPLVPPTSPSPSLLKNYYHQAAEASLGDCLALDPVWLADRFPGLWQRMMLIDIQLTRLEARNAEAAEYEAMLDRLIATVKQARQLYEFACQKKAVNQ